MKISKVIETLTKIQTKYGDISVTGGYMSDDNPLSQICVTDEQGHEIWPDDPNNVSGQNPIDGVFLQ